LQQYLKRNLIEVFGNYEKLKQGAHIVVLAYPENEKAAVNRF